MGKKGQKITLSRVAFGAIIGAAVLYLANTLLGRLGISFFLLPILQNLAEATILIIGTVLGWNTASKKNAGWKVAYIVCVLVILICIILPLLPL